MGLQRQRAKQRRRPPPPQAKGRSGAVVLVAVVIALVAVLALVAFVVRGAASSSPSAPPATAQSAVQPPRIDGMPCMAEMVSFHVHAHLSINDAGRQITVPAYVGIRNTSPTSGCLYWLHTHDESGIIHIEAPHTIHPTLGMFFDVWKQPLSSGRVAGARVKPGESMKIWVDRKPYAGNPRQIPLHDHEVITIDVGPPYPREKGFDFSSV